MASRKDQDIHDFFELRHGIEALTEFASAALRFLDLHGIALNARRAYTPRSEPAASGSEASPTLREKVKRHYHTARSKAAIVTNGSGALVKPSKATKKISHTDKRLEARAHSAALLARLDRVEPRPLTDPRDSKHIGSLVRRGYAKRKRDGYVRTAKVFTADDRADAPESAHGDEITVKEAADQIGVSDSYVRLLVKQGTLNGRTDMRVRAGFKTPVKTMVLDREAVAQYAAERHTATQDADA